MRRRLAAQPKDAAALFRRRLVPEAGIVEMQGGTSALRTAQPFDRSVDPLNLVMLAGGAFPDRVLHGKREQVVTLGALAQLPRWLQAKPHLFKKKFRFVAA